MYECFHCGQRTVIWDADFDGEDYGYICPGIVHACHCSNCGAEITYFIPTGDPEGEGEEQTEEQAEEQPEEEG